MIEVSGFGFPIPFASVAEAVFPDGHNRSDFKVSAAISFSPLEEGIQDIAYYSIFASCVDAYIFRIFQ